MTSLTADSHHNPFAMLTRSLGVAALGVGAALVLAFAAVAALVVGLMIAGAALALRLAPRPAPATADVLEARRTPAGWVVETRTRRSS